MSAKNPSPRGAADGPVLLLATLVAAGFLATAAHPGAAQSDVLLDQRESADFLFGAPNITLGIRAGYAVPTEGGDVLDDVRSMLTLDRGDFATGSIGAELGLRLSERLDLSFAFESASESAQTEFRDWIGTDSLPIAQTTSLARRPLTASLKYYFMDRGREISSLAWLPSPWSPYVGAGVGMMGYAFEIDGELIDFSDSDAEVFDIYEDRIPADGWTLMTQALLGLNVSLNHRLFLMLEGRYRWAQADPGLYFDDFESIDLSGAGAVLGISARF